MIEPVADEEYGVYGGPACRLVDDVHVSGVSVPAVTLAEPSPPAVGWAGAGARRPARGLVRVLLLLLLLVLIAPEVMVLTVERPRGWVLRARLRQVGHALQELGFGGGPAGVPEQRR